MVECVSSDAVKICFLYISLLHALVLKNVQKVMFHSFKFEILALKVKNRHHVILWKGKGSSVYSEVV